MEKVILDPAIKFGAGRYEQEEHLLEECGKEIARFGKKLYIIAGKEHGKQSGNDWYRNGRGKAGICA